MEQKSFSFDVETMKKIVRGALIAMAGAGLTYIAENMYMIDFGVYTPVVVALMSILVNAGREYIKGK